MLFKQKITAVSSAAAPAGADQSLTFSLLPLCTWRTYETCGTKAPLCNEFHYCCVYKCNVITQWFHIIKRVIAAGSRFPQERFMSQQSSFLSKSLLKFSERSTSSMWSLELGAPSSEMHLQRWKLLCSGLQMYSHVLGTLSDSTAGAGERASESFNKQFYSFFRPNDEKNEILLSRRRSEIWKSLCYQTQRQRTERQQRYLHLCFLTSWF